MDRLHGVAQRILTKVQELPQQQPETQSDTEDCVEAKEEDKPANNPKVQETEEAKQLAFLEAQLEHARALVADDPKRTVQIVKNWLAEDA